MSNPFERYATHLEEIANSWPAVHPATAAPVREHVRYNAVSETVSDAIKTIHPATSEKLVSDSARFGLKIVLRYCLMAAHLAKEREYSLDQLAELLHDPRSGETLGMIAEHPLPVVRPVEKHFGLKPVSYPVDDSRLIEMNIGGGFVDLVGLERVVSDIEESLASKGEEIPSTDCGAHRNHALQPIYRNLVLICLRDENLFSRTLEK